MVYPIITTQTGDGKSVTAMANKNKFFAQASKGNGMHLVRGFNLPTTFLFYFLLLYFSSQLAML